MTDTKTLAGVEIKNADRGEVEAVFATFNVVDHDGDVTLPGAFPEGAEVPISAYNHASHGGSLPIGMGKIRTTDSEAILDGKFWLDTDGGRQTFSVIKRLAGKGQWSYGYDPLEAEPGVFDGQDVRLLKRLEIHEVSPVLVGAGVGTRTLSAKSGQRRPPDEYKAAIRPHRSTLTTRPWDGSEVVAGLKDAASVSELRTVFAWVDPTRDPETKAAYRFPHHHGAGGPASLRACLAGIAALNGVKTVTSVPAADRQGVYNHLAGHLRDADREPPELRSLDGELKLLLHEEGLETVFAVSAYLQRAAEVRASRAQMGKQLSHVNLETMQWVGEELTRLAADHKAFMHELHNTPHEAAAEEFVRYLALRRGASQT